MIPHLIPHPIFSILTTIEYAQFYLLGEVIILPQKETLAAVSGTEEKVGVGARAAPTGERARLETAKRRKA
jgi:hypothetical protein